MIPRESTSLGLPHLVRVRKRRTLSVVNAHFPTRGANSRNAMAKKNTASNKKVNKSAAIREYLCSTPECKACRRRGSIDRERNQGRCSIRQRRKKLRQEKEVSKKGWTATQAKFFIIECICRFDHESQETS